MHDRLRQARFVLFDFDGPLCRLFSELPASKVAALLRRHLTQRGSATAHIASGDDPHRILQAAVRTPECAADVPELERLLSEFETDAARLSKPTQHAEAFVHALISRGRGVAVVTNNSPSAARAFFQRGSLADAFGDHIYGRTADPSLMKPDPDCLVRAMKALNTIPSECLMIGDSPADVAAAREAGVAFVGLAPRRRKGLVLRKAGAAVLVSSLLHLHRALETMPPGE
jgi:HAD superfamily hydrolase (TIGR01509 family)